MVLADASKDDIGWKKWFVTGWAFMECFLFGGLMFGWGSVVFMLKNEGVYADLCPHDATFNATNGTTEWGDDDEVVCEAQDNKMTLCFTIASTLFSIGAAVLGHVNYMFGTRVTRILSFYARDSDNNMVLADASKDDIGWKKWFVTGWAFMECFLFGGLMFGWGSVVFMLKNEGVYADLCPHDATFNATNGTTEWGDDDEVVCEAQDNKMTLCFTIASTLFSIGAAVLGHVNYMFGTRVTRILSFCLFIIGSLMMAFTSKETPWLMFPGLSLLGIGGIPSLVTNIQVSNLFVTGGSTVVGLLTGAFDSSSAVMLIAKIAADNGFSRKNMFFIITALHSMFLVSTLFFLPKDFIRRPEDKALDMEIHMTEDEEVINGNEDGQTEKPTNPKLLESIKKDKPIGPTLLECVKRPMFITHVIWLCFNHLRFFFFIGTLNQYLNRVLDNDKDLVSFFTTICFSILIGEVVTAVWSGIVYDLQKKRCKDGKSARYRDVMPAVLPLAISSGLGLLMSVLVMIPGQSVLYVTFIVLPFYRSFLYTIMGGFITTLFPSEFVGMLYGLLLIIGGIFASLQYGFFKWTEAYQDGPLHANILLLIMVLLSFLHPIYLWISCRREEKKFKHY